MINTIGNKVHWNYFIALEQDLENVSRYIEFSEDNLKTYSIELAHLLFASASEVDVIAKLLCKKLRPTENPKNINQYKRILIAEIPDLPKNEIFINRYGLSFKPWGRWLELGNKNPLWWTGYNKVKHQRDKHFNKATLKNAINALGALLIVTYYYYRHELGSTNKQLSPKETTRELEPKSTLLTLPEDYYYNNLIV